MGLKPEKRYPFDPDQLDVTADQSTRRLPKQQRLLRGLSISFMLGLLLSIGIALFGHVLAQGPRSPHLIANNPGVSDAGEMAIAASRELVDESVANCTNSPYRRLEGVAGQAIEDRFDLEEAVFVDPPNPDGATLVDLGLYIVQVTNVDPVNNTYTVEAYLDLVWCDPRLTFDPADTGTEKEVFLEDAASLKLSRVWWPDITLVNEAEPRHPENQILSIFADGTVDYEEKFNAVIEANYDLHKFPFDRQTLHLEIESFAWSSDFLIFHEEENKIGFGTDFEIPEWRTKAVKTHIGDKQEVRDRSPFSEFSMEIEVIRRPGYYVFKIIVPLVLIVGCSWSVFWMIGDGLADRMSVSLTGVLTVVAYQFLISEDLPRASIMTFMDGILLISFIFMVLTILENVVVNVLYLREQEKLATKVDRTCAYSFPTAYGLSLVLLSIIYLWIW